MVKRIRKRTKFFLAFAVFCFACFAWGILETYVLPFKIQEITIFDEDIPAGFKGKKIVFISDIHRDFYFSGERMEKLIEQSNKIKPDLVFFGGDFIDKDEKYVAVCAKELAGFEAKIGKFGVLGNHDYFSDTKKLKSEMQKSGVKILDNSAEWIEFGGGRLKIGGVGDYYTFSPNISPTIKDAGKNDFAILLSHNPDFAETIKNDKIDLVLSGHLHGGQITFFGLFAPWMPTAYGQKYRSGLAYTDFTRVITSKGVGMTVIPLRFFAWPEIVVVNLK